VIQDYLEDLFGAIETPEKQDSAETSDILLEGRQNDLMGRIDSEPSIRAKTPADSSGKDLPLDLCPTRTFYNPNEYRWGDRRAVIYDYQLSGEQGPVRHGFERGQKAKLEIRMFFASALDDVIVGFAIKTVDGRTVFGANTRERGIPVPKVRAGQSVKVLFNFTCALVPGEYFVSVGIAQDDPVRDNAAVDRRYDLIHMPIRGAPGDFGIADIGLSIRLSEDD
jgi:lipopolysaccharide transport system ATP-binding protein